MHITPESFTREFGTPTDVWVFGIILVEIMTEKYSWGRMLNMMDMFATLQQKNLPPSMYMLDAPLQDVAKACLQYEPKKRPSMTEVIKLLFKAQDAIKKLKK